MPDNKAKYISVAVITEGEQSRAVTGSPPNPVAASSELWVVGSSCELLKWPLTATGNVAPNPNIQGLATTLTGPLGSDHSYTYAVDFDSAGNQYAFNFADQGGADVTWSVPVFAKGVTGNVAPIRNITGSNTGFDTLLGSIEIFTAGLCVDSGAKIYVGAKASILRFNAGADGNAVGTLWIDNDPDFTSITSLRYDATRNWIWASSFSPIVKAFDLSGTQQRALTFADFASPWQVTVGVDGKIYVADANRDTLFIYVFAASAAGGDAPIQTIEIDTVDTSNGFVAGVGVDTSGIIYSCYRGIDGFGHVVSFPANTSGVNPTPTTDISGNLTDLDMMIDTSATYPQQLNVR